MRSLRLSLVGTVIVALLGGPGVAVVAQSEEQAGLPVHVTGTATTERTETGTIEFDECGCHRRGETWEGSITMSDPRLSGFQWSDRNIDQFAPLLEGGVYAGNMGIVNDEGTWEGTFSGVEYPDSLDDHLQALLKGDGGYRGFSAVLLYSEVDGSWEVEGLLFPGGTPPLP